MLKFICPKLPMRNINATKDYYINNLGFTMIGDFGNYLLLQNDAIEVHFFEYKELDTNTNYGQVYIRLENIEEFYKNLLKKNIEIHPNGKLETKPWGQKEFSLVDPDINLLTFGEEV